VRYGHAPLLNHVALDAVPVTEKSETMLTGVDQLRYRLLPYIDSSSWRVIHEGYTMMRALLFDFAWDPKAVSIADQYMFGRVRRPGWANHQRAHSDRTPATVRARWVDRAARSGRAIRQRKAGRPHRASRVPRCRRQTLTIGARSGAFPGVLQSRTFNVVFVSAGHGVGISTTTTIDRAVTYSGGRLQVVAS
jgi:hypothetical protein